MTKDVNIWMKVIEKIGFRFVDEQVGRNGDQNILHYESNHIKCKIWFNRITDKMLIARITTEKSSGSLTEKEIYDKFIKKFREVQLNNILYESI